MKNGSTSPPSNLPFSDAVTAARGRAAWATPPPTYSTAPGTPTSFSAEGMFWPKITPPRKCGKDWGLSERGGGVPPPRTPVQENFWRFAPDKILALNECPNVAFSRTFLKNRPKDTPEISSSPGGAPEKKNLVTGDPLWKKGSQGGSGRLPPPKMTRKAQIWLGWHYSAKF